MKNIYQCERCGKVFESYDECYYHENKHYFVSDWSHTFERECQNHVKYTEKSEAPSVVGVELNRWDDDAGCTVRCVGVYQLKEVIPADYLKTDQQYREEDEKAVEEMEKTLE